MRKGTPACAVLAEDGRHGDNHGVRPAVIYVGEPETMSMMVVLRGRGTPSMREARRYVEHVHRDVYGYHKTDLADTATREYGRPATRQEIVRI